MAYMMIEVPDDLAELLGKTREERIQFVQEAVRAHAQTPAPRPAEKAEPSGPQFTLPDGRVPTPEQLRKALSNRRLLESSGLPPLPFEESVASVMNFDEDGGASAVRADIERAKNIAAEQGRPWHEVMLELHRSESDAMWKMAREIAERDGRQAADVLLELISDERRQKSGKTKPN